jgi:hypothetical protein
VGGWWYVGGYELGRKGGREGCDDTSPVSSCKKRNITTRWKGEREGGRKRAGGYTYIHTHTFVYRGIKRRRERLEGRRDYGRKDGKGKGDAGKSRRKERSVNDQQGNGSERESGGERA